MPHGGRLYAKSEVANRISLTRISEPVGTIARLLSDDSLVRKVLENQMNQIAAEHATDFEPPIYNIWKQQEKTAESGKTSD
jgi:delta 1-pyrroline-5-carboxylate dehydrogenase